MFENLDPNLTLSANNSGLEYVSCINYCHYNNLVLALSFLLFLWLSMLYSK